MYTQKQLVFLDESIFKQQTGWLAMYSLRTDWPASKDGVDDLTRGAT